MRCGAGSSIRKACRSGASWNTPRGASPASSSTARSIRCRRRAAIPHGVRRRRAASCSQSRARATSPTCGGWKVSKPRWRTSPPPACCACANAWARSCGSCRRVCPTTGAAGSVLPPAAAGYRTGAGAGAAPRARAHAQAQRAVDRPQAAATACAGGTARKLPRSGIRRLAAQARHRPGGGRHRRALAAAGGRHRRLRLYPAARRRAAVCERLRRCRAGRLGRAHPRLEPRPPAGARAPRQPQGAVEAQVARRVLLSTTMPRCARRSTRWR